MPGGHPCGVLDRRDRDEMVPALLDQQRHLDDATVDAGLRSHPEDALGTRRGELVQPFGDLRFALEFFVVQDLRRGPAENDEVPQEDPVRRYEAAGAPGEVHRHAFRVTRAERLQDAPGPQGRGDQIGGAVEAADLRSGDALHERLDGGEIRGGGGDGHDGRPTVFLWPATAWAVSRNEACARSWVRCATAM